MSFHLRGEPITGMPAIGSGDGARDIADLDLWIAAAKKSPRLRAIAHPEDRPPVIYTSKAGRTGEFAYYHGYILPVTDDHADRTLMAELADHLNEIEKTPNQSSQSTRSARG